MVKWFLPRIRHRAVFILVTLSVVGWIMFVKFRFKNSSFLDEQREAMGVTKWPRIRVVNRLATIIPLLSTLNESVKIKYSGTPSANMAMLKELESNGCPLPKLQIDDPLLQKYFKMPKPLKCNSEKNWVNVKNRTFYIDPDSVQKHGEIRCSYVKYWRHSDHRTLTHTVHNFLSGTPVLSDYFKVSCKASNNKTFRSVYATVVPSKNAIKRAQSIKAPNNALGINVYLLGLEKLGGAVLKGYNIVGDGTPQAFIPILTGKTEVELPLTRDHSQITKRYSGAQFCDVYPMLWKDFLHAGYVTLYGEDAAKVGTFTYRLKGFRDQPTDHYFRTFYTLAEHEYRFNPEFCFGSEPQHRTFFRYAEDFFSAYPDVKKFGVMHHAILTHDNINTVRLLDEDLLKHLKFFEKESFLNNTLLVLMSDHGHRFSQLRETQQGQMEERLPFFSFVAPEWFKKKYKTAWNNLMENRERLTSPFDIHATLKAIIDWKEPAKADLSHRSLSLWDEIPMDRNCADAGVEAHWCVCLSWQKVPESTKISLILAKALVQAINHEILPHVALCSPLKLKAVVSVKRLVPAQSVMQYKGAKDKDGFTPDLSGYVRVSFALYQITLRTTPGDALYEATISYDGRIKHDVEVDLDSVSHINKFWDKPHCIIDTNYFMAKWCVCYDKIMPVEPR